MIPVNICKLLFIHSNGSIMHIIIRYILYDATIYRRPSGAAKLEQTVTRIRRKRREVNGARAQSSALSSLSLSLMLRSFGPNLLGSSLYSRGFHPSKVRSRLGQTRKHAGSRCGKRPRCAAQGFCSMTYLSYLKVYYCNLSQPSP